VPALLDLTIAAVQTRAGFGPVQAPTRESPGRFE